MVPGDMPFWRKFVSPALRKFVPGVTTDLSALFVHGLALEDCGDFVWALVCITRAAPFEIIDTYTFERPEMPSTEDQEVLLDAAISAGDFYGFPSDSLRKLMVRLKRNIQESPDDSDEEEAHVKALTRIEDIIIFLAEKHPNAQRWLKAHEEAKRQRPQQTKYAASATGSSAPSPRTAKKRPNHLRLV